jgi:hypothetical protein
MAKGVKQKPSKDKKDELSKELNQERLEFQSRFEKNGIFSKCNSVLVSKVRVVEHFEHTRNDRS